MKASHYSISYLQSKISVSRDSHPSGKPYLYSMYYFRRLVCWRDDSASIYDVASDPSFAEISPLAYKSTLELIYERLVDEYYNTQPCKLFSL